MIFNTTSKSDYVLFVKCRGLIKNPNEAMLIDSGRIKEIEEYNYDPNPSAGKDDYFQYIFLPVSILLEDQIVSDLKLIKLGIYSLKSDKVNNILKALRPTKIGDKTAGVKAGFIQYWKADFSTKAEELENDLKKQYTVSFVTPIHITSETLEEHLYSNGKIIVGGKGVTYTYVRASARKIGGRKYKNKS